MNSIINNFNLPQILYLAVFYFNPMARTKHTSRKSIAAKQPIPPIESYDLLIPPPSSHSRSYSEDERDYLREPNQCQEEDYYYEEDESIVHEEPSEG